MPSAARRVARGNHRTLSQRRVRGCFAIGSLCVVLLALAGAREARPARGADTPGVRLAHEPITLPTFQLGPAERNPVFYHGRRYQGAQGRVYAYPLLDRLTDDRVDKTYDGIVLENEYVRFSVLPEIGGRILTGTDKTNQYEFFYREHVIKPALIGMAGAWISGGVEWNIPHHHRASTYMPVDYRLVKNADGSQTVWVGETELRHHMKWLVGLTLHPGRSYLTTTVKLFNRTPLPQSMLYFANVAVHANPDYQVIFPPSTQFGTQHAKREFIHWPIARESYAGYDYSGVDVSWWKNHPKSISIFACNDQDDFFGGYDHGQHAGVVQVADHNTSPGKKFFEWGAGEDGAMWDKVLTETDGPYLELMSGAWSDNQPDYSWVHPYEVRIVDQYWYPIRDLGGIKQANLDAALNLDVHDGRVRLALNTTARFAQVRARLQLKDATLLDQTIDIAPDAPWSAEAALPAAAQETDLVATLTAADGRELIRYQPQPKPAADAPLPDPVEPPPAPAKMQTVEELYLTGLRLEQFHNPVLDPDEYYHEALRRDPNESRVNTALGIRACKRGEYEQARQFLQRAVDRVSQNYTRPQAADAYFYLGLAQRGLGDDAAADRALQRAAWDYAWRAASYEQLAELACRRQHWSDALEKINQSLTTNAQNTKALALKAAILRHQGKAAEALATSRAALALDPLDFYAAREERLALAAAEPSKEPAPAADALTMNLAGDPLQTSLQLAVDYGNAGLWDDAIAVLNDYCAAAGTPQVSPLVHYYLGFYYGKKGDAAQQAAHDRLGRQMSPDYCFPSHLEAIAVLRDAMAVDPQDPRAPYYLGNLLYDIQPRAAIAAWEQSRALDDSLATVNRNLGLAYLYVEGNPAKAVAAYEKALACDQADPRVYTELDACYRLVGADPAKRLALLEAHHDVIRSYSDALLREVLLDTLLGRYDRALQLLESEHFRRWEGEMGPHDVFAEAHLLRGLSRLQAGRNAEALRDFEAAQLYPDNLEVGRPRDGIPSDAKAYYLAGLALQRLGQADAAKKSFAQSAATKSEASEARYYRALAQRKLGNEQVAAQAFEALVAAGRTTLQTPEPQDFFAKFGGEQSAAMSQAEGHFLVGLGRLGQGDTAAARREFEEVVRIDVDHLGARGQLAYLEVR